MEDSLILIFELIGTVAFAFSGALTGLKKKMDIFGVAILGIVTSVGGGVIRDVILGLLPPATFRYPIYSLVATAVSVVVFIFYVNGAFDKEHKITEIALLVMDSIGLGVFTVVGIRTAIEAHTDTNVFLLVFVGVVTGCGGGVIRDMLAKDMPYIFVKHFYACASIIGSAVCIVLWRFFGDMLAMTAGSVIIIVLRILAAHFRWSLPKAK